MTNKKTIDCLTNYLERLLDAKSIKYSDWKPEEYASQLKGKTGVYHFFIRHGEQKISLYVEKAGLGKSNNWDIYKRLKQHFQTSQKNTFLGKYAKSLSISRVKAKNKLNNLNIEVQWLIINTKPEHDFERNLMRIECFCKAILNPKFTDQ